MSPPEETSDLVVLRVYKFHHEAELARSVLEAHDILSMIAAAGPWDGTLSMTEGVRLLVRKADAEEADEVLGQPGPVGAIVIPFPK